MFTPSLFSFCLFCLLVRLAMRVFLLSGPARELVARPILSQESTNGLMSTDLRMEQLGLGSSTCQQFSISSRVMPFVSGMRARAKSVQRVTTPAKMKKRPLWPPRKEQLTMEGVERVWVSEERVSVDAIRPTPIERRLAGSSSPISKLETLTYLLVGKRDTS